MDDKGSPEDRITSLEEVVDKKFPPIEKSVRLLRKCVDTLEATSNEAGSKVANHDGQLDNMSTAMTEYIDRLESLETRYQEETSYLHKKVEELQNTCAALMKLVSAENSGTGARKLKAPQPRAYSGARDSKEVDNFIFDIEQYFRVSQIEEELKIDTASMYLAEDAKLWWCSKYAEIETKTISMET